MKKKLFRTHAFITGIVLIGFICITIINYCTYSVVIRDDIRNISRLTSLNIFSSISNELTKPIFVSLTMANDSFLKSWLRGENDSPEQIAELQDYLNGLKRKYDYSSVFLVSAKTNIYYHYNGINKVISRDDSHDVWYYNFVASGIPHRLEVDTDEMARNELTVFVDCRIEDDHGELMGVVGVGVKIRELQQILASFELDFDLTAFLVNREGVVQVHTSDAMIANATIDDLLPVSEYRKKIFTKSRVESSWYKYNGQETCLVTRYIDDLDWYLIVEKDTAIIKESLLLQLWKDILVVACIIILILLLVSGTVSRYDKFMTLFATTDKLTGLMNRERFNAILSRKLWERPLVFMFDVDHFKHINDTRGHLWGNEVLARVGHKAEEIVGKAGCVARWGGDEFIGFIDAPGDAEETLRCLLESVRDLDNHVTISIGATRINPEDDMDAILMRVDDGMYRSKAEGRDRITYI